MLSRRVASYALGRQRRRRHLELVRLLSSGKSESKPLEPLILKSTIGENRDVTVLQMNRPATLNAWTDGMMKQLHADFDEAARDDTTKVLILTGTDPYYCAGVNLAGIMQPMMPKTLHGMIVKRNQALFDMFLDFPKPIIAAVNGPAIGASVTSATLCDGIVASENATFHTPFNALGITPEGCSSVHFERIMGEANAARMLGEEGWKPTAHEAEEAGFVLRVAKHEELLSAAGDIAQEWIAQGKVRDVIERGTREELKMVNAKESVQLADAFLGEAFLRAQETFLKSKGKDDQARVFSILLALRPLWSKLL